MSPFKAMYSFKPRGPDKIQKSVNNNDDAQTAPNRRLRMIFTLRNSLVEHLTKAKENQAQFYNQRHQDKVYAPGDEVMLLSRNLQTIHSCKKLDNKYYRSFLVIEAIENNTYQLKLPLSYQIHNVFHVSLLEPYHTRTGETPMCSPTVLVDDYHEWEVDKILDNKAHYHKRHYLVKWKGFSIEKSTWEPEENLKNAQETLKDYLKKRQNYKKINKSTYRKKDKHDTKQHKDHNTPTKPRI
ncbi:uncharacterized protein CIMG_12626 [Coccidioides immitis RS]|uniref:Chromo domain-containing protein n=1 Tax=Coccidioides immitis (strain RS) TaxID=246410 RepID=J3KM31_COCIM|nr:uncharacterized protein CIMG_12626 [Coccidioides immitis RS]EAS37420.3 hypothetical protein CIMG_12626 [Coccidioides immitis RS]